MNMEEFIETFHIDWKLMIAQAVNFLIVLAVFYFLAAKPLRKLMKDRGEEIEGGLNHAKEAKELLQKASAEYEENTIKLRKLSIDAQKELGKDLEKLKAENLERIKADNEEWTKNRLKQMEIDKKALVESARGEVMSLAMLAAEKIMQDKNKKKINN
ncbi:hypothetical protein A2647_05250 [Candidatus Nomurabacteria bacterium RIFCSPHIGHO2_01_FULL_40_24b]|uniref:ATP synthase subunit b n=2 Tax=Candidatus Nomuraibacteriota TaxID=1752729 RepID=A0A1F6V5X2_9BACT|nr:MAG: hypothetical protein A2647_05250 [Candidatus Nomurabacteria bacterium RIFCSPHIGHO2_01_FULL_40_24b]